MIDKVFINSICGRCAHVDVCSSIKDNRQKCGFYLEQRPHETLESAIDYLTEIGWLPEHDRILTETRPHGEWIPINIHAETWDYKCSVCGAEVDIDFPNCPYCLANMQKKEGGEK